MTTTSAPVLDALVDGVERHRRRVGALGPAHHLRAHPGRPGLQLVGRGGAEGVGGAEHHAAAVGDQDAGQLADRRRLAGAVDADDQQHRRLVVVRQRLDRAVQVGLQLLDQHLAQHRAGVGLGAHAAAGHPGPQRGHHRFGDDGAEVGDQQGVLDGLPGLLVEVAAAEQAEHAAAQRVLRLGQPPAQPVQPAFRRRDGVDIGAAASTGAGSQARARRRGFGLCQRRLGQLDVGDRSFRRVARNGGIIADGGQPAGIDAFDRLSRR